MALTLSHEADKYDMSGLSKEQIRFIEESFKNPVRDSKDLQEIIYAYTSLCLDNVDEAPKDRVLYVDMNFLDTSDMNEMKSILMKTSANIESHRKFKGKVTYIMFDVADWNVSNVEDFTSCFECWNSSVLIDCDLSGWICRAKDYTRMFAFQTLFNRHLPLFDFSECNSMRQMFKMCKSLNQRLESTDLSNVIDYTEAFYKCMSWHMNIDKLKFNKSIDAANIYRMFYDARNITYTNGHMNKIFSRDDMKKYQFFGPDNLIF